MAVICEQIGQEEGRPIYLITLNGILDTDDVNAATKEMRRVRNERPIRVTFNFTRLEYMVENGHAMIMQVYESVVSQRGSCAFVGLHGQPLAMCLTNGPEHLFRQAS